VSPGAGLKPLGAPVKSRSRPRWALGLAVGAGVAVLSYAGQRLGAWGLGEPAPGLAVAGVYTAYFWRLGLAALHGLVAGTAAGFLVSSARAERLLGPAGPVLAIAIAGCAASMVWVP